MGVVVGDGHDREFVGVLLVVGVAKVANGVFVAGETVDNLIVVSGVLVATSGIETLCHGVSVSKTLLAEHLLTEVLVGSRIGVGAPELDLLVGAGRGIVQIAPLSHTVAVVVGRGRVHVETSFLVIGEVVFTPIAVNPAELGHGEATHVGDALVGSATFLHDNGQPVIGHDELRDGDVGVDAGVGVAIGTNRGLGILPATAHVADVDAVSVGAAHLRGAGT